MVEAEGEEEVEGVDGVEEEDLGFPQADQEAADLLLLVDLQVGARTHPGRHLKQENSQP